MSVHIKDGLFQSDKYPTCPPGKVPLSVADPMAQDLLWAYAQRRRSVDAEFSENLEACLKAAGYEPTPWLTGVDEVVLARRLRTDTEPPTMCEGGTIMGPNGKQTGLALQERGILVFSSVDEKDWSHFDRGPQHRLALLCDSVSRGLVSV